MAIKLADTLQPMSEFPAAMAEHIGFSDGATLQEKFDNKELGGGDNSTVLTQEEYEALPEEERLNGLYYTYDTKRIYKNGVQYGASDAEDIGYNNAESGIQATTVQGVIDKVVEKVDGLISDTTSSTTSTWSSKKTSDEIDALISDTSSTTSTYSSAKIDDEIAKHSLPLVFDSGFRVNAAIEIYKLSNVTYEATNGEHPYNLNLLLSTRAGEEIELFGGKNDSGWKLFARKNNDHASKIMDVYLDGYDVYVRLATYYNFFKVYHKNGALRSDFAVTKVTSIPDTATEIPITAPGVMDDLTSTESTWSSSKIASEINPTIDRTDLFPSNELDLNLLYNRCGTGVYDIVGQGSAGHGMIRADLWAINNGTICYIVSIMYSDGSSSTVGGNINAQPTVPINSKWMSVINKLTKIGYL